MNFEESRTYFMGTKFEADRTTHTVLYGSYNPYSTAGGGMEIEVHAVRMVHRWARKSRHPIQSVWHGF